MRPASAPDIIPKTLGRLFRIYKDTGKKIRREVSISMYRYTYTSYRAITPGQICLLQKYVCAKEVISVQKRYLLAVCW